MHIQTILPSRLALVSILLLSTPAWAARTAEVEYTVNQVLAQEGALYVNFSVGESGKVVMLFGVNEPDWRVEKTVKALQSHPDIPGLTWVKTDIEFCTIR